MVLEILYFLFLNRYLQFNTDEFLPYILHLFVSSKMYNLKLRIPIFTSHACLLILSKYSCLTKDSTDSRLLARVCATAATV